MKQVIIIFLLFSYSLFAQVEYSRGVNSVKGIPLFSIDVANYYSGKPEKTKVDFFIQVPFNEIQFTKKTDGFHASFNITLTFMDKDKSNILSERTWKEQVFESDFNKTISRDNFYLSYRPYDLKPGDYFFKCMVEDLDSRNTSLKEFPFKVEEISDSLGLSDLMLISEIKKDSTGESIVPNISKIVTNNIDSLKFYFDVYSSKERQVYIEYTLNNVRIDQSTKTLDPRTVKAGKNALYFTLHNMKFKLGEYDLSIVLKDDNWKEVASVKKKFFSKIEGLPNSITDLDMATDQLLYIASSEERSFISAAKDYNEKLERFIAFWESKKPNPHMNENPILYEYYRRIEYAVKNFKGMSQGWRTDMGMIFVTFGPPSNVERHPFDSDSRPYEIWEYYDLNRSFVFVDQNGFGDFRLYNPDFSRWPGYRQ